MVDDIVVSYRINEPYSSLLESAARERRMSPHQLARLLMVDHFERSEELDLKDDLREVQRELRAFRDEFNTALE